MRVCIAAELFLLSGDCSYDMENSTGRVIPTDFLRLDQDILTPLAGKQQLYTFETPDFWEQIKTPG